MVRQAHHERSCGQAVVEFALAIPIFLVLILGVLDAGRGVVALNSLSNAAREGARYGAIAYPAPTWQADSEARARATGWGVEPADLTVTVAANTIAGSTYVDVAATYNFHPVVPGVTVLIDPIPLTANVRMLARQP